MGDKPNFDFVFQWEWDCDSVGKSKNLVAFCDLSVLPVNADCVPEKATNNGNLRFEISSMGLSL